MAESIDKSDLDDKIEDLKYRIEEISDKLHESLSIIADRLDWLESKYKEE